MKHDEHVETLLDGALHDFFSISFAQIGNAGRNDLDFVVAGETFVAGVMLLPMSSAPVVGRLL